MNEWEITRRADLIIIRHRIGPPDFPEVSHSWIEDLRKTFQIVSIDHGINEIPKSLEITVILKEVEGA